MNILMASKLKPPYFSRGFKIAKTESADTIDMVLKGKVQSPVLVSNCGQKTPFAHFCRITLKSYSKNVI